MKTKTYDYPELTRARSDMHVQNELYRPTAFWEGASSRIITELHEHGVEDFRSLPTPLAFFVPTYGIPGGGFSELQADGLLGWFRSKNPQESKPQLALEQFLRGEVSALSDYRVLLAADDPGSLPYLHKFSESTVGSPVEQFEFDGHNYSRSSLNYLLGLALLKKHLDGDVPRTVLEIGGGVRHTGRNSSQLGYRRYALH